MPSIRAAATHHKGRHAADGPDPIRPEEIGAAPLAAVDNLAATATTLAAGTEATVTVTGDLTGKVINLGLPRGADGPQGQPGMGYEQGQALLDQNADTLAAAQTAATDAADAIRDNLVTDISTPGNPAYEALVDAAGTIDDPTVEGLISDTSSATRGAVDSVLSDYPTKGEVASDLAGYVATEDADASVAALVDDGSTQTAQSGDARWLKGTRDANNTIRALTNTNDNSAGTSQSIFVAAPSPTSPHTINGAALLRLLLGGYDSTMGDALASTMIAPMHCTLDAGSTHGLIVGGSYQNLIGANYSAILGGTKHTIGKAGVNSNYSAILGGNEHTVTAYYSGVVGGWQHKVTAQGVFLGGGYQNEAHGVWGLVAGYQCKTGNEANPTWGQYTTVAGGYRNHVGTTGSARFSSTVGGRNHDVQVESAGVVGGNGAKPRFNGAQAWANGWQTTAGDAQMERAVFRGQSTDAFAKQLLVDGVFRLTMPANTTWAFEGMVTGRRGSDGATGAWKIAGVIARGTTAGSTALVGTPGVAAMGATSGDASAWVVDVVADTTFGALSVRGRSPSAGTVNWVGGVDLTEVTA